LGDVWGDECGRFSTTDVVQLIRTTVAVKGLDLGVII
jgi:hypothetical protein